MEKSKSHESAVRSVETQAGDREYAIYVEPGQDLTWMAVASPQAPSHAAIKLCLEQSYPYRQIEVNGNSMLILDAKKLLNDKRAAAQL